MEKEKPKPEMILFGGIEFTPEEFIELTKESNSIADLLLLTEAVASIAIKSIQLETIEVKDKNEFDA